MAFFRLKMHFSRRKSAKKCLLVNTASGSVVRPSLAYVTVQKWLVGTPLSTWNFGRNWTTSSRHRFPNQLNT